MLLKNIRQNTKVVRTAKEELRLLLGAEFAEVSTNELHKLGLLNGIKLNKALQRRFERQYLHT